jgi:AcrR family transcriptional regulator
MTESASTSPPVPAPAGERVRIQAKRRRKAQEAARGRLLQAGAALIAEHGLEGANSNQIARAAGAGVGTFYAHFEDKHALHRAVVRQTFEGLQASLARAAAESTGLEDQVRALVDALCAYATAHPDFFRISFGRPLPAAMPGEPALSFSTRGVEQRLDALRREGRLDIDVDPAVAASATLVMQTGVVLQWLDGRLATDRETLIETLTRLHPALSATHD